MRALDSAAPPPPVCRTLPAGAPLPVAWYQPEAAANAATLDTWCATTGSPVVALRPDHFVEADAVPEPLDELVVVSWNVHVGGANLPAMIASLRTGALTGGRPVTRFVLLLQETYRAGPEVPRSGPPRMGYPAAVRPTRASPPLDIVEQARRAGLSLFYVPSMRNGSPAETDEDRGNAILSTEPLADLTAIELPFERQRRVAVSSTIRIRGAVGEAWPLRLVSVHLETPPRPGGPCARPEPRQRQAAGLLAVLPPTLASAGRWRPPRLVRLPRTDLQDDGGRGPRHRDHQSPSHLRAAPPAGPRLLATP